MQEKYIGLILAISSSFLIGASFIVTKLGLQRSRVIIDPTPSPSPQVMNMPSAAQSRVSQAGEGHDYLSNGLWWAGMVLSKCCPMSS